ncbi:unnamed protein product [Gongylonema pulchrum]|uniref:VWFA domain-containing protein n=1 Tax=Gongylonema pulchrum TaxID=637853 RepID=A0A183DXG7_9BILA|nr:unnamed protein product [Gongylonema pulchrum]
MKAMLEQHQLQISENSRRIEQMKKFSRSLNVRLFGYDFSRCIVTVTLDNGTTVDRVDKPYDLFIILVVDGMNRTIEEARSLALQSIHWTGRLNNKCVLFHSCVQKTK